jgi:hypothetical protein
MHYPAGAASTGGAETCMRFVFKAELVPRDVYLMVDRSEWTRTSLVGSPGGTYWGEIVHGLTTFLNDPAIEGMGVGLQFFPLGGAVLASCNGDYATPEVEIGDPQENRAALDAAMAAQSPRGPRPTGPALAGAIAHAKAWAAEHTTSAVTVVLVTGGLPDVCTPGDVQGIAEIARAGQESTPGVQTHVVALGPDASTAGWDTVSRTGGTRASSSDAATAYPGTTLHGALRRLFATPVECGYALTALTSGGDEWSDPGRMTVNYTTPAGTFRVPFVNSIEDCDQPGAGFYVVRESSESRPSRIELCPSTCDRVQGGEVELGYDCSRVPVTG